MSCVLYYTSTISVVNEDLKSRNRAKSKYAGAGVRG